MWAPGQRGKQIARGPQRREQISHIGPALFLAGVLPPLAGSGHLSADGLEDVRMGPGVAPVAPPLARIGGFEGIGQAVLNGRDERAAGVDAPEILGLAIHEHAMKGQNLVVTHDIYCLNVHRFSSPDELHDQLEGA